MYIVFLAILLVFSVMPMVDDLSQKKKAKDRDVVITEKIRCKRYWQSIVYLWGSALAVFIMCLIGGISPQDIGLRLFNFQYNIWITVTALAVCGFGCVFFLYQSVVPLIHAKQREEAKKYLADDKNAGAINILPRTKKKSGCFVLSLSVLVLAKKFFTGDLRHSFCKQHSPAFRYTS